MLSSVKDLFFLLLRIDIWISPFKKSKKNKSKPKKEWKKKVFFFSVDWQKEINERKLRAQTISLFLHSVHSDALSKKIYDRLSFDWLFSLFKGERKTKKITKYFCHFFFLLFFLLTNSFHNVWSHLVLPTVGFGNEICVNSFCRYLLHFLLFSSSASHYISWKSA